LESFSIDSFSFLAVANYANETSRISDSKIYIWNGLSFAEYQAIPTNGANDWESFYHRWRLLSVMRESVRWVDT
jgi:hypothetical protein